MPKHDDLSEQAAILHARAEAAIRESPAPTAEQLETLTPETTRKLLHELRVQQVELEMQNEELRRAQLELGVSRARYFGLYDLAPVGYCTLSDTGQFLEANLRAATLLGVARSALVRQAISHFIRAEDQDTYYWHRKQLVRSGEPQSFELQLVRQDRSLFWAQLELMGAQHGDSASELRLVLSDISPRKQAEAERAALEARLQNTQAPTTLDTLSDRIAQDLNDVIAVVLGNAEIVRLEAGARSRALESLEEIRKAAVRARDLVQLGLSVGRRQPGALKAATQPAHQANKSAQIPARTLSLDGGLHVLYLDENAALVSMIKRLLMRRGYRVTGFTDPRAALEALRAAPRTYDLLVTDYKLSGSTGLDVAREARAIRANLPVGLASGLYDSALNAEAKKAGVREVIFKAADPDDFCEAVQRLAESAT